MLCEAPAENANKETIYCLQQPFHMKWKERKGAGNWELQQLSTRHRSMYVIICTPSLSILFPQMIALLRIIPARSFLASRTPSRGPNLAASPGLAVAQPAGRHSGSPRSTENPPNAGLQVCRSSDRGCSIPNQVPLIRARFLHSQPSIKLPSAL